MSKMSMKLLLLFGVLIASWTVDGAAIQNAASRMAIATETTSPELIAEKTLSEPAAQVESIQEKAPETEKTAETEKLDKTEENEETEGTEGTERPEGTEETKGNEGTEETKGNEGAEEAEEVSSPINENDTAPSFESNEPAAPVQFKHFVKVESRPSEIPPPPFGINPNYKNQQFRPQQQEGPMRFALDPNMINAMQGQPGFFHQGRRQGHQSSMNFSPRNVPMMRKPFNEDPIGFDDEPSLNLMSTRAPFVYPNNIPMSKPMMHYNSLGPVVNEFLQNPQNLQNLQNPHKHMMMPVTVETSTGPMVMMVQVPSGSYRMNGF